MRRAALLVLAMSAVAVSIGSGSKAMTAAKLTCLDCPPMIATCSRVSCDPCCYRCPGSKFLICES